MKHDHPGAVRSVAVDAQNPGGRVLGIYAKSRRIDTGTTAGASSSIPAPAPSPFAAALDAQNPGGEFCASRQNPEQLTTLLSLPHCSCPITATQHPNLAGPEMNMPVNRYSIMLAAALLLVASATRAEAADKNAITVGSDF